MSKSRKHPCKISQAEDQQVYKVDFQLYVPLLLDVFVFKNLALGDSSEESPSCAKGTEMSAGLLG